MDTTEIRTDNANHLRVTTAGGFAQISRVGKEGDVMQALTILPEELAALLTVLQQAKQEAA